MAVLNPVNPSIATTSMQFFHASGQASSQALNAALERPSTMSSNFAGPVLSLVGVRSMITVTYLSPRRVWRQTCSSTPITRTPSKRAGSSISSRFPSARTASLAVCQATPSPAATRAIERWSMTRASSAHRIPPRESFARSAAAAVVSSRQWHPQWSHR